MIRVLVVDDSPAVRELLIHILGADPNIEVVGWAADGESALRMVQEKKPDVVTMDLQMPKIDGFEATRRIMQTCPTPIVIVSGSESQAEIDAGFCAIEAGALAIAQRPSAPGVPAHAETARALLRAVKAMAEVKVVRRWSRERRRGSPGPAPASAAPAGRTPRLALLAASTGGPTALRDILAELAPACPFPILIVQHMAAGFSGGFAEWLSASSGCPVRIAVDGEFLTGRRAYLAPDGFQIAVTGELRIALSPAASEHGMRPSASHLFRSLPRELCRDTVAALLTGMGKDGAAELRQLKDRGAITIVQDRATSAVYGMPGEALRQDAARLVLTPAEIGKVLHALGNGEPLRLPFLND